MQVTLLKALPPLECFNIIEARKKSRFISELGGVLVEI
jgi:hypothetical protein